MENPRKQRPLDGEWIPTVCTMCYNGCSIQVLVKEGMAVSIRGAPGAPPNYGKMCAKGKASLTSLYNPKRVLKPLRRTNPEKGLGVDPRWEEITWEEALNIITEKLNEVREHYPGGVSVSSFDSSGVSEIVQAFLTACGGGIWGRTVPTSQYLFCGRAVHPPAWLMNGSADRQPDLAYCQYMLVLGGGFGTGTGTHAMPMARGLADARVERGMKMVVIDPCRTSSGARADEWIPLLPGTDSAFLLAIMNVLINELDLYDKEFLRHHTNATYLIRPNGHYARDGATGKPLVLSRTKEEPVPYDAVDSEDMILEDEDEVGGEKVRTAFVLLREHLKGYTPEYASQVTTVPAATIRRIATEFGTAARIGATVVIDGVKLPLRPACALWYRGIGQHQHGLHHGWAAAMLNIVVGAVDVPGGCCDTGAAGPWGLPEPGPDGLLHATNPYTFVRSWMPARPAEFDSKDPSLLGMFPTMYGTSSMGGLTLGSPAKFRLEYPLRFWIHARGNPIKSGGDPEETAEILKRIPFQLSFVQNHEETSEFADIVLPDTHSLERLVPLVRNPYENFTATSAPSEADATFATQQPVVKPLGEARHWAEVLWDLAHRAGFADDLYRAVNVALKLDPEHRLKPGRRYPYEQLADLWMRSWLGDDHGLDYFKEHGWAPEPTKREVRHRYPRSFHKGRIPLYLEHWLDAGESVRKVVENEGIRWGDLSDYEPLVNYRPCWASREGGDDFPLYLVSTKVGFLTLTSTIKNPHIQDIAQAMGEIFNVGIHPSTAKAYGISDGGTIEIEAPSGKKQVTVARVTPDVHPRAISVAGNAWRVLSPDGKQVVGQGVHLNSFLSYRLERIDMVSAALDACVKVRIRKVKEDSLKALVKRTIGIFGRQSALREEHP